MGKARDASGTARRGEARARRHVRRARSFRGGSYRHRNDGDPAGGNRPSYRGQAPDARERLLAAAERKRVRRAAVRRRNAERAL